MRPTLSWPSATLAPPSPVALSQAVSRLLTLWPLDVNAAQAMLEPGPEAAHTARTLSFPLDEGRLPGTLLAPKNGDGATVLLVHGAITDAFPPYMFFARELLARGFNVATIHLDGHGPNARPFRPERLGDNVPAALAGLREAPEVDAARLGLFGISLGGACALHAAPGAPGVRAVASLATPVRVKPDSFDLLLEVAGLLSAESLPTCLESCFQVSPPHMFRFLETGLRVPAEEGAQRVMHMVEAETHRLVDDAIQRLAPLAQAERLGATPLLVLQGAMDHIVPPSQARALHAAARGPKALTLVPGYNHFTIMTSPQAIREVADWFSRHL